MASLNPAMTVGEQIAETLTLHRGLRGRALDERVLELLRQVRISDPERRVHAYPHQMSGGIRQRVAGAIAISCQPSLLIADEPTTSLDVTIQAQYLRLLKDIQRETDLAMVFVTHDLGIVAKLCDRVAVMYAGRIVETGTDARDLQPAPAPLHHRSAELPAHAAPRPRAADRHRRPAAGSRRRPGRLRFAPRCALAEARCSRTRPALEPAGRTPGRVPARRETATLMPRHAAVTASAPAVAVSAPAAASAPEGDVVLEARALTKHFPVARGAILGRDGRHGEGRRRRELRPAPRARRSGSWARAAAARRPRRAWCCAWSGRPAAASSSTAATSTAWTRGERASIAARSRPCSRTPTAR